MKAVIFFILICLTLYAAAMYQYQPLLLLFFMECFFLVIMVFQAIYFKKSITLTFLRQTDYMEKGTEYSCMGEIHNRGNMPVNRLAVRVRLCFSGMSKSAMEYLYGGSSKQEDNIKFEIYAWYCGLLRVKMESLKVFDYLSLFSMAKPLQQEMTIAVFPKERPLHIELSHFAGKENLEESKQQILWLKDAYGEIRQIREYHIGDTMRHIHWNQSARTDQIWIREYEGEMDLSMELLLEIEPVSNNIPEEMDAFFELLSALVLGLLQHVPMIRVNWYDGSRTCFTGMEVSQTKDCRELLLRLYRTDFSRQEPASFERFQSEHGNLFRLTSGLSWFYGKSLIYGFSKENLDMEIAQQIYIV